MTAYPIILSLSLLAAGGSAPKARPDPSKWSSAGWQTFRWGMGVGDVENAIRNAQGLLERGDLNHLSGKESTFAVSRSPENADVVVGPDWRAERTVTIARVRCSVQWAFYKGELFRITLHPLFTEQQDLESQWSWYEDVLSLLAAKYGPPDGDRSSPTDGQRRLDRWKKKSLEVEVNAVRVEAPESSDDTSGPKPGGPKVSMAITYRDPQRAALAEGVNPADKEKL